MALPMRREGRKLSPTPREHEMETKLGITVGDDDADGGSMSADGLSEAISEVCYNEMLSKDWLIEAVVSAVTTDDLPYLATQIERHIKGWTRP